MRTRKWIPVFLPFAVGLVGSNVHRLLATPAGSWEPVLASLYCIPIVIAAITLGGGPAVIVALLAGGFHSAAAVFDGGEPWVQLIVQTILFVCIGLTAGQLADWLLMRGIHAASSNEPMP